MRRIGLTLLLVLSASLLLASPSVAAAQATPTGDPASKEVEASVSKFITIFTNRISRHDQRAFDQMDDGPMSYLFGAADRELAGQALARMLPAKVELVDDVRVLPDGTISAVVSISGLLAERAYFTFDVVLTQDGESYRITGLRSRDAVVFPEGAKVAEIAFTIKSDGTAELDPASVPVSDYLLFKLDNQSAIYYLIALYPQGATVSDPSAAINGIGVLDGSTATFATVGLEPGQYTLNDASSMTGTELAVLTIEAA